jgi:predicted nucleic acid-binding protein
VSIALHATCFDASALVKRYVDEAGSQELRRYWATQATRYTTPFCFYETLSILKSCWRNRKTLAKEGYLKAAWDLHAWFRASQSDFEDIDFTSNDVFVDAKELAEGTDLDLSDAFQLLSLQAGYFSGLVGGSRTLLVTADEALAKAARQRKLPVWDCLREPMPLS